MTTPTRRNARDVDLECVEPSNGCFLIVTAKSGKQKCAYEDALDMILLSRKQPKSVTTNSEGSAIVFELGCQDLTTVRKMFSTRPSACISSVMVSRSKLKISHEIPDAYLKEFSVHMRERSNVYGYKKSKGKNPHSLEVFGNVAFVVRERWI